MRLLVTGASGFVGSHVARAGSQRGDTVRCLVRASSNRGALRGLPVETVVGDLGDADSLERAVRGVDAVVHCAATTSETSPDWALSHRTNALGTANLLSACEHQAVRRFVLVSTQSANADNTSAYGTTKLEAERIVAAGRVAFTILRPSTVYGPGARGLFAKISHYVATLPVIPIIGDGRQRFRPICVGDLATAILDCLGSPQTVGKTYDLGGGDGVSFAEFIDGIGAALGKQRPKLRVPVALCLGLARGLQLVAKNPPLTVDNIIGMTQMRECDISRAQQDFGFRPLSFREGIEQLRRNGMGLGAAPLTEEQLG